MYKSFKNLSLEEVEQSVNVNMDDFIPLNDVLKKKDYIDKEQYERLMKLKRDLVVKSIYNYCDMKGLEKPELKRND